MAAWALWTSPLVGERQAVTTGLPLSRNRFPGGSPVSSLLGKRSINAATPCSVFTALPGADQGPGECGRPDDAGLLRQAGARRGVE